MNSEAPWCEYVVAEGVSGRDGALVMPLGHPGRGGPQGRRYDRIQGRPRHLEPEGLQIVILKQLHTKRALLGLSGNPFFLLFFMVSSGN